MADNFLYGMSRQLNRNLENSVISWKKYAGELEAKVSKHKKHADDRRFEGDRISLHYVAMEAERDYLLKLLDHAYGKEKNPARQLAYPDDNSSRIPAGSRKGERISMRDKAFYTRFRNVFKKNFEGKYNCDWKKMLLNDWIT